MQQILGHSSILTTARYTHLTQSTGRNAEQAIDVRINALSSNCGVRR